MFKKARPSAPRKIGQDDPDQPDTGTDESAETSPVVVKRPVKGSTKTKKPSTLRASFEASEVRDAGSRTEDGQDPFASVERKRAALDARHAELRARLPIRDFTTDDKPSYSADYLAELKSATPTRPVNLADSSGDGDDGDAAGSDAQPSLDIASKFGTAATTSLTHSFAAIPSAIEIQEKKERRRRLALEQKADDYIALDDDGNAQSASDEDEPRHSTLIIPADEIASKQKYPESRLGQHALDDDDLAEGFDDFVEDSGKVALNRRGRREQAAARRAEIAAQIRGAEGKGQDSDVSADDDEPDKEEAARVRSFEAAQTRAGTYGARHTASSHRQRDAARAREGRWQRITTMQYKTTPVPDIRAVARKWDERLEEKREEVRTSEQRIQALDNEQREIEEEEERMKGLLTEAGQRLERLMRELPPEEQVKEGHDAEMKEQRQSRQEERKQEPNEDSDDDEREDEDAPPGLGHGGLGFGSKMSGFAHLLGPTSERNTPDESDRYHTSDGSSD